MLMAPPSSTAHSGASGSFGSCCSSLFESKGDEAFGAPATTLFLIDYDDTILASSWLAARSLRLDSKTVPDAVAKELRVLESGAIQLLSRALALGKVALVTNAEAGWIDLSARKFLPNLVPLLSQSRILSARTTFEKQYPKQTQLWKNAAYGQVFAEAFESAVHAGFKGRFNVLSLGDSLYERNALLHLTAQMPEQVLGKSVKLIERPTIEQLQRQLEILVFNMDTLTSSTETIDLMLTVEYISDC